MTVTTGMQQIGVWVLNLIAGSRRTERGSSLIEYALLVTLIAVVCLLALNQLGHHARDGYSEIATSLTVS